MAIIKSSVAFRRKHGLPPASGDLKFPSKWMEGDNRSKNNSPTPWTLEAYIREFEKLNGLKSV